MKPACIIGVGEIGGVFARGLLKAGIPVYPINRSTDMSDVERTVDPELVILGVGEKDFKAVAKAVPQSWHGRLVLVQNELLPNDWFSLGIHYPTVVSVWFEKKYPSDFKPIIASPVYGPQARIVCDALSALKIPCRILTTEDELLTELVLKNLYILTTNIAGLRVGGTVAELWDNHRAFATEIANEVLDIQFRLTGRELDRGRFIEKMVEAFNGDPQHKCMGRSAPQRLERAVAQADQFKLDAPNIRALYAKQKTK